MIAWGRSSSLFNPSALTSGGSSRHVPSSCNVPAPTTPFQSEFDPMREPAKSRRVCPEVGSSNTNGSRKALIAPTAPVPSRSIM
jgi:hypothetical protein